MFGRVSNFLFFLLHFFFNNTRNFSLRINRANLKLRSISFAVSEKKRRKTIDRAIHFFPAGVNKDFNSASLVYSLSHADCTAPRLLKPSGHRSFGPRSLSLLDSPQKFLVLCCFRESAVRSLRAASRRVASHRVTDPLSSNEREIGRKVDKPIERIQQ